MITTCAVERQGSRRAGHHGGSHRRSLVLACQEAGLSSAHTRQRPASGILYLRNGCPEAPRLWRAWAEPSLACFLTRPPALEAAGACLQLPEQSKPFIPQPRLLHLTRRVARQLRYDGDMPGQDCTWPAGAPPGRHGTRPRGAVARPRPPPRPMSGRRTPMTTTPLDRIELVEHRLHLRRDGRSGRS